MIAVMGAAGNVGSKVVDLLLEAGEKVRVLQHSRDVTGLEERGVEVVSGDALRPEDLRRLFSGASATLVLLPEDVADPDFVANRELMSGAIRDALREENVSHVVALSAVGAARADAPGPPGGLHGFEKDLAGLDEANVLVLRSSFYMDYLLAALPMIQSQATNGSAVKADVGVPMIATEDVAREAAERLSKRDFSGHQVELLLGPEDVTMAQATQLIGERLGNPNLPYIEFPAEGVKAGLQDAGMSEEVAGLLVDMQLALNEGIFFEGEGRTADQRTETTLEDFLTRALPSDRVTTKEEVR